ncbi:MAG TPA: DUF2243 domain-containing protein [Noviherbaspirillum sp.]|uniref:DUF2243 domain-containing protein n=1 Tax=Noviherbaspirillum sp. TaxID=1926288 RepID=UPI002D6444B3|nr:DUF2243 domain-containing protein [Noviherbaspirillum sp.]HYD96303.1 DUF2243 domain-containing protein [Noviherbaspirillum sp.]
MDNRVTFLRPLPKGLSGAGFLLGFSLGGFFDGILLHQVMQWHHLLSGIGRPPFDDLRVQLLADGLFHAAMYVIAAAGLWKLLKARFALVDRASDRLLVAAALIGFGAWHIVDAVLSHWVLGLHRIRMDVPNPLLWDLLWFGVFGVLFVAAGLLMRRPPSSPHGFERRSKARSTHAPMLAAGVVLAALTTALGGRGDPNMVTVLLRPGATPAQLLAGLHDVDGRVVWNSVRGEVWVLALGPDARPGRLYAHGAMLVSGTILPAGCSAWVQG